jgi:hypothetical protein
VQHLARVAPENRSRGGQGIRVPRERRHHRVGLEMPLEAMKLALVDRAADKKAGFLRKEALLAVVFLTDEEDCSSSDALGGGCMSAASKQVSEYVKVLEDLKGAGRFAVAAIAGDYDAATSPSPEDLPPPNNGRGCTYNGGIAVEATRLKQLVSSVGKNGVFQSIRQSDLSGAIASALGTFEVACRTAPPPPR